MAQTTNQVSQEDAPRASNILYTNDNLFVLHGLNSDSVDLIYLDPPFNSKRMYSAPIGSKAAGASFKDMWTWQDVNESYLETIVDKHPFMVQFIQSIQGTHSKAMMAYITYMAQRLIEMHRILKSTGSIYLHCDPTASHYLKVIMDEIFGRDNFRNEIVWCYRKWNTKQKQYPSNHDIILFYSKSLGKYHFNSPYIPKSEKTSSGNRTIQSVFVDGKRKSVYLEQESKGTPMPDWWEVAIINPMSKERTGYPTQKPLALLHRIIKASSKEGDIVLDPFCGCATTCVAAQQLNRKWIGIDIEQNAVKVLMNRLSDDAGMFEDFINTSNIPQRTDIQTEDPKEKSIKERLFKQQEGHCNACSTKFDIWHFEVDHIIPKAKGGGDYYENYQLLCGNCNRIKGDRPMEYLRMKIKNREDILRSKIIFGE